VRGASTVCSLNCLTCKRARANHHHLLHSFKASRHCISHRCPNRSMQRIKGIKARAPDEFCASKLNMSYTLQVLCDKAPQEAWLARSKHDTFPRSNAAQIMRPCTKLERRHSCKSKVGSPTPKQRSTPSMISFRPPSKCIAYAQQLSRSPD